MSIVVHFGLEIGGGRRIEERDLALSIADLAPDIEAEDPLYGFLRIRTDHDTEMLIEDEMDALAANMCFRAVTDVVEHRRASYRHFAWPGEIILAWDADVVSMRPESTPGIDMPAQECLRALHACGTRYMDLLGRVRCFALPSMRRIADAALPVLQRHGLA